MLTFGSFHFVATKTAILQLNLLVNTVIRPNSQMQLTIDGGGTCRARLARLISLPFWASAMSLRATKSPCLSRTPLPALSANSHT